MNDDQADHLINCLNDIKLFMATQTPVLASLNQSVEETAKAVDELKLQVEAIDLMLQGKQSESKTLLTEYGTLKTIPGFF